MSIQCEIRVGIERKIRGHTRQTSIDYMVDLRRSYEHESVQRWRSRI
jgi:hypothetical protein